MDLLQENDKLTYDILNCAYKVHSNLGPGLLESVYQKCLAYELRKKGYIVEVEKELPIEYEDIKIECGYRLDLLVENKVIIELKAIEKLSDVHTAQILTYLKLSGINIGLLINFNVTSLKNGIKRFIL